MKIEKQWADKEGWFSTTEEEFLDHTENAGYFKPGTALQALKDVGKIRTAFAFYRIAAD